MVNPLKGESTIEAGGSTYTLALDINAIVELEQLLNVGIVEIAAWFSNPAALRLGNMRAVLWSALQRHHSDLTLIDAGNIIGEVGLSAIVQKLGAAVQASFPQGEGEENPQAGQGQAGTGLLSSSSSSASTETPKPPSGD